MANASNNNIAVFDVSAPGAGRALGFIPTGWMPSSVRVTPDGRRLLVISARGLEPKSNPGAPCEVSLHRRAFSRLAGDRRSAETGRPQAGAGGVD